MKKLTKKQKQRLRLTATYTLMLTMIVGIVTLLMFAVLGYQFNGKDGRVEQGGLLQFGSNPSGANVRIDGELFGSQTSTRTTFASGVHTINFNKPGYQPWQKTIQLPAGSIVWLNYARLIPAKVTTQAVASLPSLTSAIAAPNQQTMAAISDDTTPKINLFTISDETIKTKEVVLPEGIATPPKLDGTQQYSLQSWSDDSKHVLVKHSYESDTGNSTEWLVVDVNSPKNSKNISVVAGLTLVNIKFLSGNGSQVYGLSDTGDLRRIDSSSGTISSPLAAHVTEFQVASDGLLTYVTSPDEARTRSVGYVTSGASVGHQIKSFTDDGTAPLRSATGTYYNQRYIAISYGAKTEVMTATLPNSESDEDVTLQTVQSVTNPHGNIDFLSMRTEGRFVVAQSDATYTTYDVELQKTNTTTVPGDSAKSRKLDWIDNYHIWTDLDGQLRFYEFDGANPTAIMKVVPGFDVTLSQNGKYAYGFSQNTSGGYDLVRARLLL